MSQWQQDPILDRGEGRRSEPGWATDAWQHPRAQVLGVDADGHVSADEDGLRWVAAEGACDPQRHFMLGLWADRPIFITPIAHGDRSLRELLPVLDEDELQLAFGAVGLAGWHAAAGFCPACGTVTTVVHAGHARRCPGCGREDYPRTDPAVIVAITDSEARLLLGRQPSWPSTRYSVLAGFVETGESLEQTVRREVGEEVGVRLGAVDYLGSQPWPFPRSLMVAFHAHAVTTQLTPAPGEIETAAWFSRDDLRSALADGSVTLPPSRSIARRMIQAWLEDTLGVEAVG
ncbi:MAG TPA: NAD(+) diphosphatase [Propionicimonas sp.]|nr:NAD(+) diphosphatase [Propionicimonas sp.]